MKYLAECLLAHNSSSVSFFFLKILQLRPKDE